METVDSGKQYEVGGYARLSSVISIVKREHGENAVIIDSGDQFTGSLLSQYFNGSVVTDSFNKVGVRAATFGNHEFDLGFTTLKERII